MIKLLHVESQLSKPCALVFDALSRLTDSQPFCHTPKSLTWVDSINLRHCHLFMHHTVTTFHVHLPPVLLPSLARQIVADIASKLTLLRNLSITLDRNLGTTGNTIFLLLRQLPFLRSFSIHNAHLSADMFLQLSALTHLTHLLSHYGHGKTTDQAFPTILGSSAFPQLHCLTLTAKLKTLSEFLTNIQNAHRFTTLHISSSHLPEIGDGPVHNSFAISSFITVIAFRCLNLADINLDFSCHPPVQHVIGFHTLRPLSACHSVISFAISHEYSLSLHPHQVEQLVQWWPKLKHLCLNPHPMQLATPLLHLHILDLLTTHCPNLEYVGLYMDCRRNAVRELQPLWQLTPFIQLKELNVGFSPIGFDEWYIGISAYIAHLCPDIHSIHPDIPWMGQLHLPRSMTPTVIQNQLLEEEEAVLEDVARCRTELWLKVSRLLCLLNNVSKF
jgi:hypothetical protein